MRIHSQYNELEKGAKENFLEFHAPKELPVNRVLVRKYTAKYNGNLRRWVMPTKKELLHKQQIEAGGNVCNNYKYFRYDAIPIKQANKLVYQIERGEQQGTSMGAYIDLEGVAHRGICKVGNFYLQIVQDLDKEVDFLDSLLVKSSIPAAAVVVEDAPEPTQEEKEIYEKYQKDKKRLTKKEFAAENEISTHILNKIIKLNESQV